MDVRKQTAGEWVLSLNATAVHQPITKDTSWFAHLVITVASCLYLHR